MLLFIGLHFDVLLFVYLVDQKSHAPCGLNKTIRDCFNRSHLDNTGADCGCKAKTAQNRGFLEVLASETPQTLNKRAQRNQTLAVCRWIPPPARRYGLGQSGRTVAKLSLNETLGRQDDESHGVEMYADDPRPVSFTSLATFRYLIAIGCFYDNGRLH